MASYPTDMAVNMTGATWSTISSNLTAMSSKLQQQEADIWDSVWLTARVWRIISGVFVFLMQLGFSLLEAGTVRFKNTRNIMIKNVLDMCVGAVAFWLLGYGIGFGGGSEIFGWEYEGEEGIAFAGSKEGVEWFFQFTFAATSATIIAGAIAERTHLWAYLTFNFFLSAIIYPVVAHLVWSNTGYLGTREETNFFNTHGVLDLAGSLVVHVTGGVTSLVGAWMVGPRIGRFDIDGKVVPFKGHSMVFIAAGTIILWVGFYGFNGGSVVLEMEEDPIQWVQQVAHVCINTTLSASFAGVTVFTLTYRQKEPQPEDTFNAVIGGLVAACATSGVVEPYAAAIVGIGAGCFYLLGCWLMFKLHIDDPVQAAPVHLCCGTWGTLAAGLFARKEYIQKTYANLTTVNTWGLFYGGGIEQFCVQIVGLLIVYVWVGLTSFIVFFFLAAFGVLRVNRKEEELGLDVAFHGGVDEDEDFNPEDEDYGTRRWGRNLHRKMPGVLESVAKAFNPKNWGKFSAGDVHFGGQRQLYHQPLENSRFGQFSLSMYEANHVMEDSSEVEVSSSGIYMAVHDGHGGTEVSDLLKESLFVSLKAEFVKQGGQVTAEAIRAGFQKTEDNFAAKVRQSFEVNPHFATVGSCSVVAIVTSSTIWVANVGDCRAVLGQVRKTDSETAEIRALQLTVDHNLNVQSIRDKFKADHADMPDAVTEKRGIYRVKGKVTVTRSFGDLYLKSHEFNREPLFSRFRVPEPYNPPLLTCEPNIAVRFLSPHDSFVILASDGLFEYISNQEAVDIVASSPRKDVARQLVRAALLRAARKHEIKYQDLLRLPPGQRRQFHDDISVVVFFFNHAAKDKAANRNLLWHHDYSFKGGKNPRTQTPSTPDADHTGTNGTIERKSLERVNEDGEAED